MKGIGIGISRRCVVRRQVRIAGSIEKNVIQKDIINLLVEI